MSNRIPRQTDISTTKIPMPFVPNEKNVIFSFRTLDTNEYFNLDCTCANWSSELFNMMREVSTKNVNEILSNKYKTYRVHNHSTAKLPIKPPFEIKMDDFYQIRISKSKGGIHGIFYENIFYVVWLDPLHNMYPDDKFGGLRILRQPTTCCKEREEKITDMQEELKKVKEENEILTQLFECK
jgi:hypothetical protein